MHRTAFAEKRDRRGRGFAGLVGAESGLGCGAGLCGVRHHGDRDNFSVGANLLQLLLAAQEGDWEEVDAAIRAFQQMTAAVKFCPRPVVVAPFGMTLGGGAEMCLHAARRQPHAETYIGLVEAGVGLIPGGGGTKEMLLRAVDAGSRVGAARS